MIAYESTRDKATGPQIVTAPFRGIAVQDWLGLFMQVLTDPICLSLENVG
jgi:hypothetical protein